MIIIVIRKLLIKYFCPANTELFSCRFSSISAWHLHLRQFLMVVPLLNTFVVHLSRMRPQCNNFSVTATVILIVLYRWTLVPILFVTISSNTLKAATHQANQLEISCQPGLATRVSNQFPKLPTSSQLVHKFFGLTTCWRPDRSITTCRLATCCTDGMQKTTRLATSCQLGANLFPTSSPSGLRPLMVCLNVTIQQESLAWTEHLTVSSAQSSIRNHKQ